MSANRDRMIPAPMGDCPVCGEPITPTDDAVWRDHGGWTHMACIGDPPTPPTPTEKEAD